MTTTTAQLLALVLTGLAVTVAIGTLTFRGGRWVEGVNRQLSGHRSLLRDHSSLLRDHSSLLNSHTALLNQIRREIKKLFNRLPSSTVEENSPLRLSALGREIAEAIAASAWARKMAGCLRERVSGMRPDQIHEFCFTYLYDEYQPDTALGDAISIAAYENGIDQTEVLDVLAIVLRDELMTDRAESIPG